MKITSKQIMNILDIQVGDCIIRNGIEYTVKRTNDEEGYILVDPDSYILTFGDLVDNEFILHKHRKKIGEIRCCDHDDCEDCPLTLFECERCGYWDANWSLYKILNEACASTGMNADHPIYKAFKAELDKEVV